MILDARWVLSNERWLQPSKAGFDHIRACFERCFTESREAGIRMDLQEHEVTPSQRYFVNVESRDLDWRRRREASQSRSAKQQLSPAEHGLSWSDCNRLPC